MRGRGRRRRTKIDFDKAYNNFVARRPKIEVLFFIVVKPHNNSLGNESLPKRTCHPSLHLYRHSSPHAHRAA
jgi:hypothetical protein